MSEGRQPVELTALEKHACVACGAQAEWNAAKQRLVCPFCGTEAPYELDRKTGKIREIDLVTTLRELPEELRGWHTDRRSVRCQSCKAVAVFDPARVGQNCQFCGSPSLVDYQEIKAAITPQSLLPFKVPETRVREDIRRWYARRWFAPNALKTRAFVDTVRGVYIPYWTFDAQIHCPWQAEAGHYYNETETYRQGGRRRTRQVRKIRWTPASGVLDTFFDDEPVPGSHGIDQALLKQVEPFPTTELVPYDTGFLSGYIVEHYQVVLIDAARAAQDAMHRKLMALCAAQVSGDTHRNLQIQPEYSGRTFKHVLVPVWLLTYTYGAKPYQVVVNGYTAAIAGRYPKSIWKILGAVLVVLLVLFVIGLLDD